MRICRRLGIIRRAGYKLTGRNLEGRDRCVFEGIAVTFILIERVKPRKYFTGSLPSGGGGARMGSVTSRLRNRGIQTEPRHLALGLFKDDGVVIK